MCRFILRFASLCLLTCPIAPCFADEGKGAPPAALVEKSAPAAPVKPRAGETAMKEFKAEIAALRSWGEKTRKGSEGNPAAGMRMLRDSTTKLAAIRTDGLPEDLRTAYDRMAKFWSAMSEFYQGMPSDDKAVEAWVVKQYSDPKVREKLEPLIAEGRVAGKLLGDVAKKYEIEVVLPGK